MAFNHRGCVFGQEKGEDTFCFTFSANISPGLFSADKNSGLTHANIKTIQLWARIGSGEPGTYQSTFQAGKNSSVRKLS